MSEMQKIWAVAAIGLAIFIIPIVVMFKMDESEAKAQCLVAHPSNPVEAAKCAREVMRIARNQKEKE